MLHFTPRRSQLRCLLLVILTCSSPVLALEADQIVLIVNASVPASRKLAEFYAGQRHIAADRIVELTLPSSNPSSPVDDISPGDFDEKVVPVIRNFLKSEGLDGKVTCLVTFWGIPLRVGRRTLAEADKGELTDLKSQLQTLGPQIEQQVKSAESLAGQFDPEFHPGKAEDLNSLGIRAQLALNSILHSVVKMTDVTKRGEAFEQMMGLVRDLVGQPEAAEKMSQPALQLIAPRPLTIEEIAAARRHSADLMQQVNAIASEPPTARTRARLRELVKAQWGTLNLLRVLGNQINTLDNAESESAFDSELALLWWPPYPKSHWVANPLNFKLSGRTGFPSHTLMVMRLDGPTEQSVHDLIETSLKIEQEGLKGEVVLDARGKPPVEPYGNYDQTIRHLAELLRSKTSLKIVLDDQPGLIPTRSEHDIAIYCGWYSLRHYVAPGGFNPGSVGFHVASAEMVSLHNPKETGWCRNLMIDGVAATLGPVAEPYLESFPKADEFFPLLMTGKLTLAEVYWKTTPWASWMQCCVGDPLYRPYLVDPPLKTQDLPEALKPLVQ